MQQTLRRTQDHEILKAEFQGAAAERRPAQAGAHDVADARGRRAENTGDFRRAKNVFGGSRGAGGRTALQSLRYRSSRVSYSCRGCRSKTELQRLYRKRGGQRVAFASPESRKSDRFRCRLQALLVARFRSLLSGPSTARKRGTPRTRLRQGSPKLFSLSLFYPGVDTMPHIGSHLITQQPSG